MVGSMIQNLFNFKGSKNPDNHVEMVKTAFEIASKFRIENIELKRISGKYSRKNGWGPNPKIWYVSSDGGESININPPTTPMGSKYLVAVLYCLCYYFNILQSSELFYNDKKGISQSIATKHGPQKSGYMKELIATLGDENLELELISLADNPLPESLTELQRSLVESPKNGIVSAESVTELMKVHNSTASQVENEYNSLKIIMESDNRLPISVNYPKLCMIEHEQIYQEKIELSEKGFSKLEDDLRNKADQLKRLEQELENVKKQNQHLTNRGLFARLFNLKG